MTRPFGRLALLGTGLFLAFVGAEIALRIAKPIELRTRGNILKLPANVVYDIAPDATRRSDQLDPHIVHTKNSLGFRGPELPPDPDGWLKIITVGGSTTECFYLSDGKTWPDRLAATLDQSLDRVWLDNAGLDGHSTFGHLLLLRQHLERLAPDYLLFLIGINDVFTDRALQYDRVEIDLVNYVAERSDVVAVLSTLLRHASTRQIEDLGVMPKPPALSARPRRTVSATEEQRILDAQHDRLTQYDDRVETLVRECRRSGIEPVLITQPMLPGGVDAHTGLDLADIEVELGEPMNGRVAWALLESYNEVTRDVGRRENVLVIDLGRQLPKDSRYFYDFFHFTNEGAEAVAAIVAEALAPWLVDREPDHRIASAGRPDGSAHEPPPSH